MDTLGKAQLTGEIAPQRAVVAYVPRQEIMTVLQDPEAQPELQLQFHGGDEPRSISMEWSRNELEDMLARATGDTVVLTFDGDELAHAFADVEAHGLREKALVFAVAATGALGAAGLANAQPVDVGAGAPAVTSVAPAFTDASSGAGYAAPATAAASDQISDAASGSGYAAPASAADTMLTDASSGAGYTAATTGSAADTIRTDASSGAGYAASGSAADTMLTDASSGAGYTAATTGSAADTIRTDASSAGGYNQPAGAASGTTFSLHRPDTTDTFLVGGVLLTLAGATFASRRRTPIQPA
jgi:hypothetical protein